MKLDKQDLALVNATPKKKEVRNQQKLCNIHLNKGVLEAADGFMLVTREADISLEEKELTTLIPTALFRAIKIPQNGYLRLGIAKDTEEGTPKPIEFACTNMDRPIRGLIMPVYVQWDDFEWKSALTILVKHLIIFQRLKIGNTYQSVDNF